MKRLVVLSIVLAVALLLTGCNTHKLAIDDLNRLEAVRSDLDANYDRLARLLLRTHETEIREVHFAKTKLELRAASKPEDVERLLDQLQMKEDRSGVITDNLRDHISFLQVQAEKTKALSLALRIYMEGNKGPIELLQTQLVGKTPPSSYDTPTSQADVEPLLLLNRK